MEVPYLFIKDMCPPRIGKTMGFNLSFQIPHKLLDFKKQI
ncbi:hypothetical protein CSB67_3469 [Enterobacter hormaechei]|nr:hypothetical protein CSB67_3469 [Enterobacter hormaechei]